MVLPPKANFQTLVLATPKADGIDRFAPRSNERCSFNLPRFRPAADFRRRRSFITIENCKGILAL